MNISKKVKLILGSAAIIGLFGLSGCDKTPKNTGPKKLPATKYFAEIPMFYKSGAALTAGDFDGDGDLDFILASYHGNCKLYLFKNDGTGKFYQD